MSENIFAIVASLICLKLISFSLINSSSAIRSQKYNISVTIFFQKAASDECISRVLEKKIYLLLCHISWLIVGMSLWLKEVARRCLFQRLRSWNLFVLMISNFANFIEKCLSTSVCSPLKFYCFGFEIFET